MPKEPDLPTERGPSGLDSRLGRRLVLDEIFDLSLYRALHAFAPAGLRRTLEALIPVETRHVAFWQKFFGLEHLTRLDIARRLRLGLIALACRCFGASAIHIVLEAIEVHGVKKYLDVWQRYGDGPLGPAVRAVLEDEFKHEDAVVTGDAERRVNPDTVRNVFLGLNDGLVEILGCGQRVLRGVQRHGGGAGGGLHCRRGGRALDGGGRVHRRELRGRGPRDGRRAAPLHG